MREAALKSLLLHAKLTSSSSDEKLLGERDLVLERLFRGDAGVEGRVAGGVRCRRWRGGPLSHVSTRGPTSRYITGLLLRAANIWMLAIFSLRCGVQNVSLLATICITQKFTSRNKSMYIMSYLI